MSPLLATVMLVAVIGAGLVFERHLTRISNTLLEVNWRLQTVERLQKERALMEQAREGHGDFLNDLETERNELLPLLADPHQREAARRRLGEVEAHIRTYRELMRS